MTTTLDLDLAYRIRADLMAWVAAGAGGADMLNPFILMREMQRRHPDLSNADAVHLAERIEECWDQEGLDFAEAPARADGWPAWFPVERDGRLQRVPPEDLTQAERGEIEAAMKSQVAHAQAAHTTTQEEMSFLGDAGMRDNPDMRVRDVMVGLGLDPDTPVQEAMRVVAARQAAR